MELKYKVWDKENNKMWCTVDKEREVAVLYSDDIGTSVYLQDGTELNDFEVLPSTGVKDINKKESYLGDILKEKIYEFESQRTKDKKKETFGIVKKKNDSNNLYLEWNFEKIFEGQKCWLTNELLITHIDRYEIVGNIYENEELIKKENKTK